MLGRFREHLRAVFHWVLIKLRLKSSYPAPRRFDIIERNQEVSNASRQIKEDLENFL